jgi:hypothetical protein
MAPRTKRPSDDKLLRWRRQGKTLRDMVELHLAEGGEPITRAALSARLRELDAPAPGKHRGAVPWTVKRAHGKTHIYSMLRAMEATHRGRPISEKRAKELENFLARIEREDVVIYYTPSMGFVRVQRATVPPERLHPDFPIMLPKDARAGAFVA